MKHVASKTVDVDFGTEYLTDTQKAAMRKVLISQHYIYEKSISNLQDVLNFLEDKLTLDDLSVRTKIQSVLSNLKYEKVIVDSFKDEISK